MVRIWYLSYQDDHRFVPHRAGDPRPPRWPRLRHLAIRQRRSAVPGDALSAAPTGGASNGWSRRPRLLGLREAAVEPPRSDPRLRLATRLRRARRRGGRAPFARSAQAVSRYPRGRRAVLRAGADRICMGARNAAGLLRRRSRAIRKANDASRG